MPWRLPAHSPKVICYFGPPAALLTDQGTHFLNNILNELARIFRIDKSCTTAYHPQSNGCIECMHHTLTEHLKKYMENLNNWSRWVPICQNTYNCTENEASNYTPHELVFGQKPRTPSSFPAKEQVLTYSDYITDLINNLSMMQTLAAMNIVQAKHRSKYYYDRKHNAQNFCECEIVYHLKKPQLNKFDIDYEGPYEITSIIITPKIPNCRMAKESK